MPLKSIKKLILKTTQNLALVVTTPFLRVGIKDKIWHAFTTAPKKTSPSSYLAYNLKYNHRSNSDYKSDSNYK